MNKKHTTNAPIASKFKLVLLLLVITAAALFIMHAMLGGQSKIQSQQPAQPQFAQTHLPAVSASQKAYADEATEAALSSAQSEVERTAAEYNALTSAVEELEQQIDENQSRINEIQEQLPYQKEASNKSIIAMYKMQKEGSCLIDMLLGSGTIMEFFENLEYLNRIQGKNMEEVMKLASMEEELTQTYNALQEDHAQVEQQRSEAQVALAAAQEARTAAQQAAEQKKKEEEEAAAAAAAAAEAEKQAQEAANPPADANTGSTVADEPQDSSVNSTVSADKADWGEDKQSFVNAWSGRINSYLSGSPLSGQGETFASAAWDYGVDPRWSPAISFVESSKGAVCFKSHNAWGWGSSSWDSWEEAIEAHVRGLSRGYGYTLSMEAAKKYCPPNWQHWYNSCAAQMDMI